MSPSPPDYRIAVVARGVDDERATSIARAVREAAQRATLRLGGKVSAPLAAH